MNPRSLLLLLLSCSGAASLLAQDAAAPSLRPAVESAREPSQPQFRVTDVTPRRPVLHDTGGDGRRYALGHTWKMVFTEQGATFLPSFGDAAGRAVPLQFTAHPGQPVAPVRQGDRVRYAAGDVETIYDLHPDHVEQSFVLPLPLRRSELHLPVATTLAYVRSDELGLHFAAPGRGEVVYGHATAIDADGRRLAIPVSFGDGAIRIPLPAAWFATARYPVCIDPLLRAIAVSDGIQDADHPSVAYASDANTFQVSYTVQSAPGDRDVLATRFTANGDLLETIALDLTSDDSREPVVASSAPHFITAWIADTAVLGTTEIVARARVSGSTGISNRFTVASSSGGHQQPSIGGQGPGGTCLAAWMDFDTLARPRLRCRVVSAAGTQSGITTVYATPIFGVDADLESAVSPAPDAGGRWLVAYTRRGELFAQQVNTAGNLVGNTAVLGSEANVTFADAAIASTGTEFFVACERTAGSRTELRGRRVVGGGSLVLGALLNLSTSQPGTNPTASHFDPAVGFDGVRFALVYRESNLTYSATFVIDPSLVFQDGHVLVDNATNSSSAPAGIAAAGFDVRGRHLIALSRRDYVTGHHDVRAALWTTLAPGGITRLDTGCGGNGIEPLISSSSVPALGTSCGVLFLRCNALLTAIGTPSIVPGCVGSPCQIGVGNATFTTGPANSILTFSIGTSLSLLGTQIAVQGMDFLPPSTATEFCTQSTGLRFTTTDTLVFTVQ